MKPADGVCDFVTEIRTGKMVRELVNGVGVPTTPGDASKSTLTVFESEPGDTVDGTCTGTVMLIA